MKRRRASIVFTLTTHNDGRVFVKTHSWYLAAMSGYAANRLTRRHVPIEQSLVSS